MENQVLLTFVLNFGTGVLIKHNFVALSNGHRQALAILAHFTFTDCDYFSGLWLFLCVAGKYDSTNSLFFLLSDADNDTIS